MEEKVELILKALKEAGKPVKPGELAEMTGLAKEEVTKILGKLKKEGKVESPKACHYTAK